jgi:hypothetical protein
VLSDAILSYDLDENAFEVDRKAALELVCAHAEDFEALL